MASAFGGLGAEQAFGTRAATMAQKLTMVCAALFITLSMLLGILNKRRADAMGGGAPRPVEDAAPIDAE